MTGEAFRRLPFRLFEIAGTVNPAALKGKLRTALRPVLRDRVTTRRLLEDAVIELATQPVTRGELILADRIGKYLEATR